MTVCQELKITGHERCQDVRELVDKSPNIQNVLFKDLGTEASDGNSLTQTQSIEGQEERGSPDS